MLGQLLFEIRRNQGPSVLVPAQDTHVDQTEKCLLLLANPGALCSHDAHKSTECSTSVIQFQSVCITDFDICGMESNIPMQITFKEPSACQEARPSEVTAGWAGTTLKTGMLTSADTGKTSLHLIMFPKHIAMPWRKLGGI
jgi:hypothetical protein